MAARQTKNDVADVIQEAVRQASDAKDSIREDRVQRIESRIDKLFDQIAEVKVEQAKISERVTHLPKKGFIVTALLLALTALTALIAFSKNIQQLMN